MFLLNASEQAMAPLRLGIRSQIDSAETLQQAAQGVMECFRREFADSVILARTYVTVPFKTLPARDRSFVQAVARNKGQMQKLSEETPVLSLLGTDGVEPDWCERYGSREHLAIPLLSEEFVAGIPMVAALIRQLGGSVDWYSGLRSKGGAGDFGVFAESFFVPDAATSKDSARQLLIPAQDFVRTYGVQTVLGVGGQFSDSGMILACIFFTRETLLQTPTWLLQLPMLLGSATLLRVSAGKIYSVA